MRRGAYAPRTMTVRCPCGRTVVRGHRVALWAVVGRPCDCGRVLQWNSEAAINRGRALFIFATAEAS